MPIFSGATSRIRETDCYKIEVPQLADLLQNRECQNSIILLRRNSDRFILEGTRTYAGGSPALVIELKDPENQLTEDLLTTVPVTIFNSSKVKYYFICNSCQSRASKLFRPDRENKFLCFKCHGLIYQSRSTYNYRRSKLARSEEKLSNQLDDLLQGKLGNRKIKALAGALELRTKIMLVPPDVNEAIETIKRYLNDPSEART